MNERGRAVCKEIQNEKNAVDGADKNFVSSETGCQTNESSRSEHCPSPVVIRCRVGSKLYIL